MKRILRGINILKKSDTTVTNNEKDNMDVSKVFSMIGT